MSASNHCQSIPRWGWFASGRLSAMGEMMRPLTWSFEPHECDYHTTAPRRPAASWSRGLALLAVVVVASTGGYVAGLAAGHKNSNVLFLTAIQASEGAHGGTDPTMTDESTGHGAGKAGGHGAGHGEAAEGEEGASELVQLLVISCVVLVIVGLLGLYEHGVHVAKHQLPPTLLPVLNAMLAEIAGLGFIGVLLQIFEGAAGESFEEVSEAIFGEGEVLIEAFEWLHNKFFLVAIVFFLFGGSLLGLLVKQTSDLVAAIAKADKDHDGEVTIEEYEAAFGANSLEDRTIMQRLLSGNLGLNLGDTYLFTVRFLETHRLDPKKFNGPRYIEACAASNLATLVELSPYTWLLLVLPLAITEFVKISHEVPGDDKTGASAGRWRLG